MCQDKYTHPIDFDPSTYVCFRSSGDIVIDGKINDRGWQDISWSAPFVDIEGDLKPLPALSTKVKMTWDDDFWYFAAEIEEPHLWATLTERDAIIFLDDDFELFIDPDGDGHNYLELEVNAYNTVWDLLMLYPYFVDDRRNHIMNYNLPGLLTAVELNGSLNDPGDIDRGWTVEVAIPWEIWKDLKSGSAKPQPGEQWRVNFSRVDWPMDIVDDTYVKQKDATGKNLRENNWVWSPTGYVNMHKPETWGIVQFEAERDKSYLPDPRMEIEWALWKSYYDIKECWKSEDRTTCMSKIAASWDRSLDQTPIILHWSPDQFYLSAHHQGTHTYYSLDHQARLTRSKK